MRLRYDLLFAMTLIAFTATASAEIKFVCHAGAPDECAFSVVDARNGGTTNFVLGPGQTHGLNDSFAGGSYCVVVSKPRAQVKGWPPQCLDAQDPTRKGKIVRNIRPGQTYD